MKEQNEKYKLTPKGIFTSALMQTGLVENIEDWRINATWAIFQLMMEQNGYVDEVNEDE